MVAPNDGWAFGTYNTAACVPTSSPKADPNCRWQNAALHYDGRTWSRASLPVTAMLPVLVSSAPGGQTWAVASASPDWAGNPAYGYQVLGTPPAGTASNVMLRYAQGQWVVSDTPVPTMPPTDNAYIDSYGLNAFAMVSPTEGWAAGNYDDYNSGAYGLLLHFDNGHWTQVTIPGAAYYIRLQAISMSSPSDGWAVGVAFGSPQMTVILHDHDGQWTREDPGIPGSLNAVYAVSPSEAWAVGSANPSSGPGLILHYLNGRWTAVTGLQMNILDDVTMVSPTEGWVVGDGAMFLHYANGQWTNGGIVIHHFQLNQVAMATSTDGWAFGGAFGGGLNTVQASPGSVLFHYDGTRWTPYAMDGALAQFAHG